MTHSSLKSSNIMSENNGFNVHQFDINAASVYSKSLTTQPIKKQDYSIHHAEGKSTYVFVLIKKGTNKKVAAKTGSLQH